MIDVAMLGPRRDYAVPRLLHARGELGTFYTDLYFGNKKWTPLLARLATLTGNPDRLGLQSRASNELSDAKVRSFDLLNLAYRWEGRGASTYEAKLDARAAACRRFATAVADEWEPGSDAVYGCSHEALELFRECARHGATTLLEQTAPPRRMESQVAREEARRWPDWEDLPVGEVARDAMAEREEAEWEIADRVLCPSDLVANALLDRGVPESKLVLVPYGTDTNRFQPRVRSREACSLRLLYIGRVSLMKGVQYLLEAVRSLPAGTVECRLAGHVMIGRERLSPYLDRVCIEGPVSYSQIGALYDWADVFVFPTLFDSYGMVQTEALCSGVPVITTMSVAVENGRTGFHVAPRDSKGIAEAITRFVDDPGLLNRFSAQAVASRERFSLQAYGDAILAAATERLLT